VRNINRITGTKRRKALLILITVKLQKYKKTDYQGIE
jgi:hypothetical protein